MSESQRAARSFSLVKVNGRFFNLRQRHRRRKGGRDEKESRYFFYPHTVQPAEHVTMATHSPIPMATAGRESSYRTKTAIEKVLPACVYLLSLLSHSLCV